MIPFGAMIDFKPSPTRSKPLSKFEPRAVPGIFIGYYLPAGGKWRGDYYAIEISSLQRNGGDVGWFHVHRIKEVIEP